MVNMHPARAAFAFLIVLLVTGLQAAPGPYVLCVSECDMVGEDDAIDVVCWSGPEESGCCIVADEAECGGCDDAESPVDVGCCLADASSCPPMSGCPESDDSCPMRGSDCFFCLPGRILAERSPEVASRIDQSHRTIHALATGLLNLTQHTLRVGHSHSPPELILASSGQDILTEICLLLI